MDLSWQGFAFEATFLGLGIIGLFGITLLPVRAFVHLRRLWRTTLSATGDRVAFALLSLTSLGTITASVWLTIHVSRCLLGYHCSANAAGGWLSLAGIGFWYLAYELTALVILSIRRRVQASGV